MENNASTEIKEKKSPKGLAALIVIGVVIAFIVVAVMISNATSPYNDGTFIYTPLEDKTYSVGLKDTSVTEIEIPTKDKNYKKPITIVEGFSSDTLKEVTVPEGITTIQSNAFSNCTALEKIELPDSLEKIGSYAFKNCSSLESITLPDDLKYLESGAFEGCTKLKEIEIPESVDRFSGSCFEGCTSLTTITYHGTVADVEEMDIDTFWPEDLELRTIVCSDGIYKVTDAE